MSDQYSTGVWVLVHCTSRSFFEVFLLRCILSNGYHQHIIISVIPSWDAIPYSFYHFLMYNLKLPSWKEKGGHDNSFGVGVDHSALSSLCNSQKEECSGFFPHSHVAQVRYVLSIDVTNRHVFRLSCSFHPPEGAMKISLPCFKLTPPPVSVTQPKD